MEEDTNFFNQYAQKWNIEVSRIEKSRFREEGFVAYGWVGEKAANIYFRIFEGKVLVSLFNLWWMDSVFVIEQMKYHAISIFEKEIFFNTSYNSLYENCKCEYERFMLQRKARMKKEELIINSLKLKLSLLGYDVDMNGDMNGEISKDGRSIVFNIYGSDSGEYNLNIKEYVHSHSVGNTYKYYLDDCIKHIENVFNNTETIDDTIYA